MPEEFHLGKSSAGWTFHFRAYGTDGIPPVGLDFPVVDFESWKELASLGAIRDEYGLRCSLDELLELIESKKPGRNHALDYPSDCTFYKDGHAFTSAEFF